MANAKIKEFLDKASQAYYAGNPLISDEVFDRLSEYINYHVVGAKITDDITACHYNRLFSLQKFYENSDKQNPLSGYKDISYSPKLDGAAISILYFKGVLVQVLTRGDGIFGKVITDKFFNTNLIPKRINVKEQFFQITGEIVAPKTVKNSRNYASGALNLKSIEDFKTRAIEFFAYGVYPEQYKTYDEDMAFLKSNGFSTVKDREIENIYPTDGIVYRINDNALANSLGFTAHHPNHSYAWKEKQDVVETTILGVEWNTGRTGVVFPTAILSPVIVSEKEVDRASLHNKDFIESLGICIGDTVAIRLAGMIIPEVVYKVDA